MHRQLLFLQNSISALLRKGLDYDFSFQIYYQQCNFVSVWSGLRYLIPQSLCSYSFGSLEILIHFLNQWVEIIKKMQSCTFFKPISRNNQNDAILYIFLNQSVEIIKKMQSCTFFKPISRNNQKDAILYIFLNQSVEIIQKMQSCNRICYIKVYWRLNMFRAAHRSSSGAPNCICILWFIYACDDRPLSRLGGNFFSHTTLTTAGHHMGI